MTADGAATSSPAAARVERLIAAVVAAWRAGATRGDEASEYLEAAAAVVLDSPERRLSVPSDQPPCAHLDDLPKPSAVDPAAVTGALLAARDALAWGAAYPELAGDSRYDAFRAAYAYAEFVGPRGPVVTGRLSAFFTIQGPGVLYPPHAHPAPEVYWVVAGTAQWRRGHEDWVTRPPGSFIFHRSGLPHATRTENEPLLALAFWTDSLDGASVMVGDAAPRT